MNFTPTSASWLNALESFFAILTRRLFKRRAFCAVTDSKRRSSDSLKSVTSNPITRWAADPDKIIAAVRTGYPFAEGRLALIE